MQAVAGSAIRAISSTRWNGSIGLERYASKPLARSPVAGNADSATILSSRAVRAFAQRAREGVAVHLRHGDVGEDDVGAVLIDGVRAPRRRNRTAARFAPAARSTAATIFRDSCSSSTRTISMPRSRSRCMNVSPSALRTGPVPVATARTGSVTRERRSFAASLALRRHRSAMRLGDVADDGETEPEAAVDARLRRLRLAEGLENVRQELRIDPFAAVGDGDLHLRRRAPRRHVDLARRAA